MKIEDWAWLLDLTWSDIVQAYADIDKGPLAYSSLALMFIVAVGFAFGSDSPHRPWNEPPRFSTGMIVYLVALPTVCAGVYYLFIDNWLVIPGLYVVGMAGLLVRELYVSVSRAVREHRANQRADTEPIPVATEAT